MVGGVHISGIPVGETGKAESGRGGRKLVGGVPHGQRNTGRTLEAKQNKAKREARRLDGLRIRTLERNW